MDFDLSNDQQMLAKTVADYRKRRSPVSRFRELRDGDGDGWDPAAWREMGELGWLGAPFSEAAGGFGGSFVDAALILEQLGRSLVPEPYLASVVLGGFALALAGDEAQRERWLTPMIDGQTSLALAWAEDRSRFDPTAIACAATPSGSGFVLAGADAALRRFALQTLADAIAIVASETPSHGRGLALREHGVLDDALRAEVRATGLATVVRPCAKALAGRFAPSELYSASA